MSNPLFDDVAARHPDVTVEEARPETGEIPATAMIREPRKVAYGGVADWASPYRHTDPALDEAWPGISEPDGPAPDCFPDGWGSGPTERDQAAIDAGNA